jgi:hypothetical protein
MAFPVKRERAALAGYQHLANLRDLLVAIQRGLVAENHAKREQVGVAIERHAAIDPRDAFQRDRGKQARSRDRELSWFLAPDRLRRLDSSGSESLTSRRISAGSSSTIPRW